MLRVRCSNRRRALFLLVGTGCSGGLAGFADSNGQRLDCLRTNGEKGVAGLLAI